ncbi:hydroxyacid dehydrogenase [Chelatococcus daeguensis]|uniref:Hydroxyacid dehydrogenase n=1 Tax=Chelatococcus daeguensis TaxID=444444 RepID=A0AAC9JNU9_9HYPH|nr:FAD-binding oxidoreductase [Chelatococcus daeguensis]APF36943.1 hydroxyacid dehydrogenase [Chelatococcus daeguensis]
MSKGTNEDFLAGLAAVIGPGNVLTAPDDILPFLREPRDLFRGEALAVVRPGSTQEVAEVVRRARAAGIAVVPQGGNTGLVGGQIPDASRPMVVLNLQKLDRIREVDALTDTMTVEAGVTLLRAQEAAEAADRLFPLSLASEGSCTIGGNIASNAGGTAVIAYGNTRDLVIGLEVVLADGRIWNGLGKLRKDNTGYDLKNLFVGSEGTLGIVTAAVLKLFPRPQGRATAFCGLSSPQAALDLLALAKAEAGGAVTTFEFLPRLGLEFVLRHAPGTRDPLGEPHAWYVLMELSSAAEAGLDDAMERILTAALERGLVDDAAIAASLDQRNAFWKLREALSEVQRHEGGSIKHDIAVPVALVPQFLEEATAAAEALVPGCRPLPFGHLGDGNVHFNVSQPVGADKQGFLARWEEMNEAVHAIVLRHGGSISAEHGIGRLKRDLLPAVKDPVALDLMRKLKAALDPEGLLNPGAML